MLSGFWPALTSADLEGGLRAGERDGVFVPPPSLSSVPTVPLGRISRQPVSSHSSVSVCVSFSSLTPQAWEVVTKSPNVPALGLGTFPVVPLEPSRTFVHNLFMELFSNPHLACALCPLLGSR